MTMPSLDRVVVINDRSVALGGATGLAMLSAALMAERGIPVTYLTGDGGQPSAGFEIEGLGSDVLLKRPLLDRIASGIFNRQAQRFVSDWIARNDTPRTVYHVHGWAQILSPSIFRSLAPVSHRLVVSAHDFFLTCPNGSYSHHKKREACRYKPLSSGCLLSNCDKRNYANKLWRFGRSLMLAHLLRISRTPALVATIHPSMHPWLELGGIPTHRLRPVRNPVTAYSQTRIPAERNSELLFVGRVQPEKGVGIAAEACRRLGLPLRVVGDGAAFADFQTRFPEVSWDGWRSHSEIGRIARNARAIVMPSLLPEPFGLVALEGLQSGLPLVCFDDAFVGREAGALGAAVLANRKTPEGLATALEALNDDRTVEQLSRNAFVRARSLSSTPNSWIEALLDLYGEQLMRSADVRQDLHAGDALRAAG